MRHQKNDQVEGVHREKKKKKIHKMHSTNERHRI